MLFTIAGHVALELYWTTYGRDYTDAELDLLLWAEGVADAYGVVSF